MNKLLVSLMLVIGLSACAQLEQSVKRSFTPSIDLAKQDCKEMGFAPDTPQYLQCVQRITAQIRQSRDLAAATTPSYAPVLPKTTTCYKTMSGVTCNTF